MTGPCRPSPPGRGRGGRPFPPPAHFALLLLLALVCFAAPGEASAAAAIRLFGTVEFRGKLQNMPRWERVVLAEKRNPTFDHDLSGLMNPTLLKEWQALVGRVQNAGTMEKLRAVSNFFYRYPYREDQEVYRLEDYWATPAEFLKNSGDCEDYAITKFYALIKLGVNPETMRIVALTDTIRNLGHAVLAVYVDNDIYILDNLTDMVMSHERYRQYAPQFSLNLTYRWAHAQVRRR